MRINADFSRTAIVAPSQYQWSSSPQEGIERVMLDRMGAESGRATSIVRYAAGTGYPPHPHPGGEEILVLSGTFSEGDAHYPEGWYLRNPPGSAHQPSSREGAIIFVKLWQMHVNETRSVRIDTHAPSAWQRQGQREVCPLFSDDTERVSLQRLASGERLFADSAESAELLVLRGEVLSGGLACERGSWIRLPQGAHADMAAGMQGAVIYLKTGHLVDLEAEA